MYKKGFRCRVCTGCGLCPGVPLTERAGVKLHVLSDEQGNGKSDSQSGQTESNGADDERIVHKEFEHWLAAVDIGTTTIAMLLYNTKGLVEDRFVTVNPQTEYGADVISRIRAAEIPENAVKLQRLVREALEQGMTRFRKRVPTGEKLQGIIAANTVMSYLFMGWDTKELGYAPFQATRLQAARTKVAGVHCFLFPGISAFVGGDIVAGMYACNLWREQQITLLIDLGTNGELVLGNQEKRIACATAAGPAFEGGVNRGIWGADMIHLVATLRREGILDETGLLSDEFFESGVRIGNVPVTQEAIRSLQLAKAAIAVGIETLLAKYGISEEQVDRVVLAGGFGYYLIPEDAIEIGLLPGSFAGRILTGGNTALAGVKRLWAEAEADGMSEKEMEELLLQVVKGTDSLLLASEEEFGPRYLEHLQF